MVEPVVVMQIMPAIHNQLIRPAYCPVDAVVVVGLVNDLLFAVDDDAAVDGRT